MKKILMVLGGVFLVGIVVIAALVGIGIYKTSKLNASSKEFVDDALPPIISSWSAPLLMASGSPEFHEAVSTSQLQALFRKLSALGSLKTYDKAEGACSMSYTTEHGARTTGDYTAHATFANGDAILKITVIQHGNRWQILNFDVNSPIFLK